MRRRKNLIGSFAKRLRVAEVTWAMTGSNDFMGKLFGLFLDLDAQVGADFEKGLAQLDAVTAAAGGTDAS